MTTHSSTPKWTWVPSGNGNWHAQLKGGFIAPHNPHAPASIVIHRRDGTASQHEVTRLVHPGSNPVVAVSRPGAPVDGLPVPSRPNIRWKHSAKRSRTSCGYRRATVFRIRSAAQVAWTYHIRQPDGAHVKTDQTFRTRAQALRACEQHITEDG